MPGVSPAAAGALALAAAAATALALRKRARARRRAQSGDQAAPPPAAAAPYSPLRSQVGGHLRSEGKKGMLAGRGTVLKPFQSNARGQRELGFYETLRAARADPAHALHGLTRFVPAFEGTADVPEPGAAGGVQRYLVLSDETRGFRKPCLVDLKIGTRTYEPDAGEEKKRKELAKYPAQAALGYRFVGMRVLDRSYDRHWGRALTPETVAREGFGAFLAAAGPAVVPALVARLEALIAWFEASTALVLISSSVLLVYDADPAGPPPRAVLIDFAHARLDDGVRDDGCITGLRGVVAGLLSGGASSGGP